MKFKKTIIDLIIVIIIITIIIIIAILLWEYHRVVTSKEWRFMHPKKMSQNNRLMPKNFSS